MKSPLGHTVICEMLPRGCVAAQLSRRYTNHCMRATSVTMLKKAGFDYRLVCGLTGHKNTISIQKYCQPFEDRKKMTAALDFRAMASRAVNATISGQNEHLVCT